MKGFRSNPPDPTVCGYPPPSPLGFGRDSGRALGPPSVCVAIDVRREEADGLGSLFLGPELSGSRRLSDVLVEGTGLRCSLPACGSALMARLASFQDDGGPILPALESPRPRIAASSAPAPAMGGPNPGTPRSPPKLPLDIWPPPLPPSRPPRPDLMGFFGLSWVSNITFGVYGTGVHFSFP